MYTDAEVQLDRIIGLSGRCPEEYRVACFEILLQGYVDKAVGRGQGAAPRGGDRGAGVGDGGKGNVPLSTGAAGGAGTDSQIPAELVVRFRNTAKRLGVELSALEALFDFAADPFDFHALSLPGEGNSEKARNVVLVVAAGRTLREAHG